MEPFLVPPADVSRASPGNQSENGGVSHHKGRKLRSSKWSSSYPGLSNQKSFAQLPKREKRKEKNRELQKKNRDETKALIHDMSVILGMCLPYTPNLLRNVIRHARQRAEAKHNRARKSPPVSSYAHIRDKLDENKRAEKETASPKQLPLSNNMPPQGMDSLYGLKDDSALGSDFDIQTIGHENYYPNANPALIPDDPGCLQMDFCAAIDQFHDKSQHIQLPVTKASVLRSSDRKGIPGPSEREVDLYEMS
ncbi:hypothetical protein K470DRAFT_258711 [Piedraia hortae CBS 480.64]|uniref:Uncharacterized protein n=1 Tax=Piedraia hortae CBS 480.64 TaxID=1314780 RepID=A0A6A7BWT9_9PEZI|nr:hypothetical protein K470DRAFT_258711 [Piedraia hortae CBS 480.64]